MMSDLLDNYIAKVKSKDLQNKIYDYLNEKVISVKNYFEKIKIEFEILKIKYELRKKYIKLGKLITKYFNEEKVVDFSYKQDFFELNHEINKYLRYIRMLEEKK